MTHARVRSEHIGQDRIEFSVAQHGHGRGLSGVDAGAGAVGEVDMTEYGGCGLHKTMAEGLTSNMSRGALEDLGDPSGTPDIESMKEECTINWLSWATALSSTNGVDNGEKWFVGRIQGLMTSVIEVRDNLDQIVEEGSTLSGGDYMAILKAVRRRSV